MRPLLRSRRVGPVTFEVSNLSEAIQDTLNNVGSHKSSHIHFANAWSIVLAESDLALQQAFQTGKNYPDGKPVVWAMNWLHRNKEQAAAARVDGPTFFERMLHEGVQHGVTHYFFGSTTDTLNRLQTNVRRRFPGVKIVGSSSPPYRDFTASDIEDELSLIRSCNPHVVWVGLGTPKQDKTAALMAPQYPGLFICVGAAFDYTAGNLRAAPAWVQDAGLGWLFRFAQEPRRLFRRYVYGNSAFVRIVLRQKFGRQPITHPNPSN